MNHTFFNVTEELIQCQNDSDYRKSAYVLLWLLCIGLYASLAWTCYEVRKKQRNDDDDVCETCYQIEGMIKDDPGKIEPFLAEETKIIEDDMFYQPPVIISEREDKGEDKVVYYRLV